MGANDGHRDRLRARFIENGLGSLRDHEVLELLLFYAIPRQNTNETAHRLMDRFGTISQVLDAPMEELENVMGMGKNSAVFLKLIPQVAKRYDLSKIGSDVIIDDTVKAGDHLLPYFRNERDELVYIICMDAKNKALNTCCIHRGSVNSTEISIRKMLEPVLAYNATKVILAHNHPSGVAIPSREDIITTKRIKEALTVLNIELVDHIIVADEDYVSMANSNLI